MLRRAALTIALTLWALPLAANEQVARLARALHLEDVIEILAEEGLKQGRALDETFLSGQGGSLLQTRIEDLYDPDWMASEITDAFEKQMTDAQVEQAAIFFESDLGQTIISLENSARRAFSDEAVEEVARATYDTADRDDPFYRLIDEYIRLNDLVDLNVKSTLSSDYNFYLGLSEGHGTRAEIDLLLSNLLEQREASKAETTIWLYSFLMLAYHPLSEADMRENIAFSRTETGRALNRALFDGFDAMYDSISFQLGLAIAQAMNASDL